MPRPKKSEQTSKVVASVAGAVLGGKYDSADFQTLLVAAYLLAGSALTQAAGKSSALVVGKRKYRRRRKSKNGKRLGRPKGSKNKK